MRKLSNTLGAYPKLRGRCPGVYAITLDGTDVYIGSSVDLVERLATHDRMLFQGRHKSSKLQSIWSARKGVGFGCRVIELCDVSELYLAEACWMLGSRALLNEATPGLRCSLDMRKRISENNAGKPKSEAHKASLSAAQKRRFLREDQMDVVRRAAAKARELRAKDPTRETRRIKTLLETNKDPEVTARRAASQQKRRLREKLNRGQ